MKVLVLSSVMYKGKLKGFLVVDDSDKAGILSLEKVESLGTKCEYSNAVYDEEYKTLEGRPKSLSKYPTIDKDFNPLSKGGVCVKYMIVDSEDGTPVGAVLYTSLGKRYNASFSRVLDILRHLDACNFTIDSSRAVPVLDLNGKPFPVVQMKMTKKNTGRKKLAYRSEDGESVNENDLAEVQQNYEEAKKEKAVSIINGTPVLLHLDALDTDGADDSLLNSANEIFLGALVSMKVITPYYHCIMQAITKFSAYGLGTLGVTENRLLYDLGFIATLEVSELVFILIHEVMHIAMKHSTRGLGKIHKLWNLACDLYINTIICEDYDVHFGEPEVVFAQLPNSGVSIGIKCPKFGVFLEEIGEKLDLNKDTPESIYEKLLEENQQNSGGGGGDDGDLDESDLDDGDSQGSYSGTQEVSVTYNGKKLEGTIMDDIVNNEKPSKEPTQDEIKNSSNQAKEALQKMKTKVKMTEMENGESLKKNAGVGCGLTQRHIDYGLSDDVDWRILLRNLSKKEAKKMFTLGMPNTDYMNRGITVAARHKVGKPTKITGIKVCIDVSGSVSEAKLNYYISEVSNILSFYNVEGELIFWSTEVGDAGDFSTQKDMLKIQPVTTGGTDVKCVFDYLTRKTEVNGKKEMTVPRDISCVFIVTDGYFSNNYGEYAEVFGRKTIWLIDGSIVTFDPLFGRAVSMKDDMAKHKAK